MEKFIEYNGTSYHMDTKQEVMHVLEQCRKDGTRIKVDYGDVNTNTSWGEMHDTCGYVGRSTGKNKIPILIYNSRSMGGVGILTNCILSIRESRGGRVLYSL